MASRNPNGRPKGSQNKRTKEGLELISRFEDPLVGIAKTAAGDVPCGVCHGKGKTKFQPARKRPIDSPDYWEVDEPKLSERTCQSCYGSGKEKISPELRLRALAELAEYKYAKRKAVDVQLTGQDGGPLEHKITIEFVRPA
jgi:hypothetical protein